MISSKEYVIKTMVRLLANPKKKFSQNFLIDYQTVIKTVDALKGESKTIIEIGPGLGALSEEIVNRDYFLYAYEIDQTMVNHLENYFKNKSNFHVIQGDFLKQDLKYDELISVVSNIPYSLTTPIIEKVILLPLQIESFVFMVQKEVGLRIMAKKGSKDYSPLSIFLSYLGKMEVVNKVSRDKFLPSPNVDSIVLKLTFNKNRDYQKEKKLYQLLNNSFRMRRKTLYNNLHNIENIKEILFRCNIKENARPEELELNDYLKILELI
mgnify:FL=1